MSNIEDNKESVLTNQTSSVEKIAPDSTVAHSAAKSFGVRRVEVLSDQYSTWFHKIILFFSIFLVSYVYSLDGTLRYVFQAYATNSYSLHSLYTTVNVIRSVVAAAAQPTYARLSDTFGRLELIIVSIIFYAVGTVIESQAFDVQRFAGGAILYQIGYTGIILMIQVTIADFSNLNWRMTASFIPALPFIINTWVSGNISSEMTLNYSWNFAIGMWAFIFPLSCIPLLACFVHMHIKARRTPEWKLIIEEEKASGKTYWRSWKDNIFVTLFWELDVVGLLFIICILGFILVPFTLAGGVHSTWKKASTIVPLVIGFVLIPFFIVWESKFARFPITPLSLIRDRGVWSALIVGLMVDFVWYMPNDFMYTVLLVGMRASVKAATRITSLYSFVSVITGPLVGLVVVFVRRVKGFIIFGVSMWIIAMGILLHFRGDNDGISSQKFLNGVIGGECLFGFGAGFFTYATQVSIAAVTSHEWMATVISLYLASYNVGAAVGASVSGAIWTNKMYPYILEEMNNMNVANATTEATSAYGAPLTFIITNLWGSDGRIAVVLAYARVQRLLCIVGLVLCFPLLLVTFFLRDHRLDSVQSLEINHDHEKGVTAKEGELEGAVILNNYDDDVVVRKIRSLFSRKQ